MTRTSDALQIIKKMIEDDSEIQEMIEEALLNDRVAQIIYDAGSVDRAGQTIHPTQHQAIVDACQSFSTNDGFEPP